MFPLGYMAFGILNKIKLFKTEYFLYRLLFFSTFNNLIREHVLQKERQNGIPFEVREILWIHHLSFSILIALHMSWYKTMDSTSPFYPRRNISFIIHEKWW